MTSAANLEAYLLKKLPPEEQLLLDANLLVNSELRETIRAQKKTYALIQQYGRKQLKAEIEAVHQKLFTENKFESFRKTIFSIFK
jgi:hypothetical protein